jgi:hypothetical protein
MVGMDLGGFGSNVNPEDNKSSTVTGRQQRQTSPPTLSTSVMEITNNSMVSIHFDQNRRAALDSAKFTAEQMEQSGRSLLFQSQICHGRLVHLRHAGARW